MSINPILRGLLTQIAHLKGVSALLSWDQEVMMPPQAVNSRSRQAEVISEQIHLLHTSDQFRAALAVDVILETGELKAAFDPIEQKALVLIYRDWKKAMCLPVVFVSEFAYLLSQSQHAWQQARSKNDFSIFAPYLEKVIAKNREKATLLGFKDQPYDGLLDEFEPGMTASELTPLFTRLREQLLPVLKSVVATQSDPLEWPGQFDASRQWRLCQGLLAKMTFDSERGRMDQSTHPFTTQFHPTDVRLTIRLNEKTPLEAISGTMHEGGHALYEQGLSPEWFGTPIGEASSLGVHESQSRIWENCVGLSRPFWDGFYPTLQNVFPEVLKEMSLDAFYHKVNHISPSLIRVDADELTYHMHIFIRYEIEQLIFRDGVPVSDLPGHWNRLYQDYLGVAPPNDALGILQDVHWSCGLFGYFPTYTLGTLMSHQFFDQALLEIEGLEDDIKAGQFGRFSMWLKDKIHCHGRGKTAKELVMDICGQEISEVSFLNYLKTKYLS